MTHKVLSFDLGGTKLAAGVLNRQGRILESVEVPALMEQGKDVVIDQLVSLGRDMMTRHPEIYRVGMASAGPLDPTQGTLLDPTNYTGPKGTWGKVPITKILQKRL